MIKVEVLGPGCRKCRKLHVEAGKAIEEAGVEAALSKVESLDDIVAYGVMMTPALVIDGEIKISGRLPKQAQMVTWFHEAAAKDSRKDG